MTVYATLSSFEHVAPAMRFLINDKAPTQAPYANTVAVIKALTQKAMLLDYSDTAHALLETLGGKKREGAGHIAKLNDNTAGRKSFEAKIIGFKAPEMMNEQWGALESDWREWLTLAIEYEDTVAAAISALAEKASAETTTALTERTASAIERITEELRDKGPTLDARTLKKMAKAAEKARLAEEAAEDAAALAGGKGKKGTKKNAEAATAALAIAAALEAAKSKPLKGKAKKAAAEAEAAEEAGEGTPKPIEAA